MSWMWARTCPAPGGNRRVLTAKAHELAAPGSRLLLPVLAVLALLCAAGHVARADEYRVTVRAWPPEAGTVLRTPDQVLFNDGQSVTLQAQGADGRPFVRWAVYGPGLDPGTVDLENPSLAFTVHDDVVLVAYFGPEPDAPGRTAWTWGSNSYGQLGIGTFEGYATTPVLPSNLPTDIVGVSTSEDFTLALDGAGHVWAWGTSRDSGGMGDGTEDDHSTAIQVPGLTGIVQVAAGYSHALVLHADGTVLAWGDNDDGQLGTGSTAASLFAAEVPGLEGITKLCASYRFSMALREDGTVWTWGDNNSGQLGDGTTITRLSPQRVTGLADVVDIACGRQFALAVHSDGTVWAWGRNAEGQLGDGTATPRASPARVVGLPTIVAVTAGAFHSLAVAADGQVWAWGENYRGCLGDGTATDRLTPVKVINLDHVVGASAGDSASLAWRDDGTAWAWGYNALGRLGDGTTTNHYSPVQVATLRQCSDLSAGGSHSVAVAERLYVVDAVTVPETGGAATVAPEKALYDLGDAVTLTAVASPDHDFVRWDGLEGIDLAGGGQTVSFNVYRDVHAVAVFEKTRYFVTARVVPAGAGTVSRSPDKATYDSGEQVTLRADPAEGWLFIGWDVFDDSGHVTGSQPSFVLTVTSDTAAVARCRLDPAGLVFGTPKAWGYNYHGQLGDGTTTQRTSPVDVVGLDGVVQLSAGWQFSVALKSNGTVWTWGINSYGQLGDGTTDDRSTPGQVPDLSDIVAVAAGTWHVLAVKADGTLWSWGRNSEGQLGRDTAERPSATPGQVPVLGDVVTVAAGELFSAVLCADGTVWTWGENGDGQLGDGSTTDRLTPARAQDLTGIVAIAAGTRHALAAGADGSLWAWGDNLRSQLGLGSDYRDKRSPCLVTSMNGVHVVDVSAGDLHSMALDGDGRIWTWGWGGHGRLGDGTTISKSTPQMLPTPTGVTAICAGYAHSMALADNGNLYAWGENSSGQLGLGHTTDRTRPTWVTTLDHVVGIDAGSRHSLAILGQTHTLTVAAQPADRGTVTRSPDADVHPRGAEVAVSARATDPRWALAEWQGLDGVPYEQTVEDDVTTIRFRITRDMTVTALFGQTGFRVATRAWPPEAGSVTKSPDKALYDRDEQVTLEAQPAAGWAFDGWRGFGFDTSGGAVNVFNVTSDALAVAVFTRTDPVVAYRPLGWGRNNYGQVGDGSGTNRLTPVPVLHLTQVARIAAGADFSFAIAEDRSLWAWGRNTYGQLGDGTTVNRSTPVPIADAGELLDVAGGYYHTVALRADGSVWTWGRNNFGQLGDRTEVDRHSPAQVPGLDRVVAVAAGHYFTLAARADGTVWGWGHNTYGQLGNGTTDPSTTPVMAVELGNVVAVAADMYHALALKSDGTVWGWGYNGYGQLGDGTAMQRPTPAQMLNVSGATAVSAGDGHSLVLLADGTVRACGDNNTGALGDGTTTRRATAVPVINLTGAVAIDAGGQHSLAVKADGTAWAWGYNGYGQLGDGTATQRTSPVQVLDLAGTRAVVADIRHSLALAEHMHTLTILAVVGGQVTGDPEGEYPHGWTVNLHAEAAEGYRFVKWVVNGADAGNDADLALVMDADKEVQAVFAFQLTLTVEHGTGSGTYDEGSVVTIEATIPAKHRFVRWVGDVGTVANVEDAQTTITMLGNYTVTATFERIIYPIVIDPKVDSDFVYQNAPLTTKNRHRIVLTIEVASDENENGEYDVEVVQTGGPGEVIIEATADPLVWHLVGSRNGVGGIGDAVIEVRVTGDIAGEAEQEVTIDVRRLGDLNGSGTVNMMDKVLLMKRLNGMPTGLEDRAFDLDGDGSPATAQDKAIMNALLNGFRLP